MPDPRYLRIVSFALDGQESAVDAALRDTCVPALLEDDAIVDAWVGRQGTRGEMQRVIASTWTAPPGQPEHELIARAATPLGVTIDLSAEHTLELAVHSRFERDEPARILRLFRGRVREGELDAYVADARSGMLADALVNDGLVAFALGSDPPDAFVTVSVWTGWPAIEEATGGNTRRPIATRNSVRLAGFDVVHYETLPDSRDRRGDPGGATARAHDGQSPGDPDSP